MKKNTILIVSTIITVIGLTIAVIYFISKSKQREQEMTEMVEQMNFEKEQIEKDYSDLTLDYDGFTSNLKNDSLIQLLQDQKTKVQQLLDELRVTKSTNARRISELKNELATVRALMIQYINQIDSLNSANKVLKTENVEVKRKYQAATETVQLLSKEKESLNEVVNRASTMEVTNFSMVQLNNKNKKTSWFSQTATIQLNFTISKNITVSPGEKMIYMRLTKPDDEVLTKAANNVFTYENKEIPYSAAKKFEYTGEAFSDVLYWKVGEVLPKGKYRVEFFAEGNRIGSFNFVLDK